jgi:L-alanine-DL-glutamate epimerase-like enolase superfamily enzyme
VLESGAPDITQTDIIHAREFLEMKKIAAMTDMRSMVRMIAALPLPDG